MRPILYEVNTRCWLREIADRLRQPVTLESVPDSIVLEWKRLGFTHVWLMGVWSTGPRARAQALANPDLRNAYQQVLPDWREADIPGSPYAIADYHVPASIGGDAGLAKFRERLNACGIKLILDFVPNHLGLDHPWVIDQPGLFVQSPGQNPDAFQAQTREGRLWLLHGKDPYFPGWTDTVQLDYRREATRHAMMELLQSVASRCDGVRCDMAMLLLNDVFEKTWHSLPAPGPAPGHEFWDEAIYAVKTAHPNFLFLAEAYWDLEPRLQELGFDYTYDKTTYDRIVRRDAGGVQSHLLGSKPSAVVASAHFLENHDEPRIAPLLSPEEHAAAALLIAGLPGMCFLQEGQLEGAAARVPVQMGRRPLEAPRPEIVQIYKRLLETLPSTAVGQGDGRLLQPREAGPGNPTAHDFVIIRWQTKPDAFDLVVVNLAANRSQCYVSVLVDGMAEAQWKMNDLLGTEHYTRSGKDLLKDGLYLDVPPHGAQLFHFGSA